MNGFPGGLTQIFWDKLQADKFSEIVSKMSDQVVEAKTVVEELKKAQQEKG